MRLQVVDYELVVQGHSDAFVRAIEDLLRQKWEPLGWPLTWNGMLVQAMVRKEIRPGCKELQEGAAIALGEPRE